MFYIVLENILPCYFISFCFLSWYLHYLGLEADSGLTHAHCTGAVPPWLLLTTSSANKENGIWKTVDNAHWNSCVLVIKVHRIIGLQCILWHSMVVRCPFASKSWLNIFTCHEIVVLYWVNNVSERDFFLSTWSFEPDPNIFPWLPGLGLNHARGSQRPLNWNPSSWIADFSRDHSLFALREVTGSDQRWADD